MTPARGDTERPPSGRALAAATAGALAVAAVVLAVAVLPAEYGIDPLGAGRVLGLDRLYLAGSGTPDAAAIITPVEGGALASRADVYRVDARQLTVPSLGSVEFKYAMTKGAAMVYSWSAPAPLDFDFHTERADKTEPASETFEKGEAAQKGGVYTAPYDGIHGWYWENLTDTDVTVTLYAAGFYSEGVLFLPNQAPRRIAIPEAASTETAIPR